MDGVAARGLVLDIGCGDRWVEHVLNGCTYVGLDTLHTAALGYPGRPDVFANAERLPLATGTVDTVLLLDVMEHVADADKALGEIARVLREDGIVLLQMPFLYPLHDVPHDYRRWTRYGWIRQLDKHGLQAVRLTYYGHPVQTAAALLCLALTKGMLEALAHKSAALLLLPLIVVAIPLINLMGGLLARVLPDSDFMPLGYRILARKRDDTHLAGDHQLS